MPHVEVLLCGVTIVYIDTGNVDITLVFIKM